MNGPTNPTMASTPSRINMQAKKTATTRYCRFKKSVRAPADDRRNAARPLLFGHFQHAARKKQRGAECEQGGGGAIRIAYSIVSPFQGAGGFRRKECAFFFYDSTKCARGQYLFAKSCPFFLHFMRRRRRSVRGAAAKRAASFRKHCRMAFFGVFLRRGGASSFPRRLRAFRMQNGLLKSRPPWYNIPKSKHEEQSIFNVC